MQFELSGCVLAEDGKEVEEIIEWQVARSVAGEYFHNPITKWIFLSSNKTEDDNEKEPFSFCGIKNTLGKAIVNDSCTPNEDRKTAGLTWHRLTT